jgi:hypothetical protein
VDGKTDEGTSKKKPKTKTNKRAETLSKLLGLARLPSKVELRWLW